jgi:hypothetical protein
MVTVQIASIPDREESLKRTIESICNQADFIQVALNGYKSIPLWLNNEPKILTVMMDNVRGDANKFYNIEDRSGYLFTADDDIEYPLNYCADMIDAIDRYKCIVTLHGRNYPRPFENYYKMKDVYRCLGNVPKGGRVDVGGTGVMAWHSDRLKVKYSDFKSANMADIWMAKIASEQGVPIMVVPHTELYLKHTRHSTCIFNEQHRLKHVKQEEILKSFLS